MGLVLKKVPTHPVGEKTSKLPGVKYILPPTPPIGGYERTGMRGMLFLLDIFDVIGNRCSAGISVCTMTDKNVCRTTEKLERVNGGWDELGCLFI